LLLNVALGISNNANNKGTQCHLTKLYAEHSYCMWDTHKCIYYMDERDAISKRNGDNPK